MSGAIDGRRSSTGGSTGHSGTAKRRFETLSYQAVEVTAQQDGDGRTGAGGILQQQQPPPPLSSSSKAKKHLRPNLGIWDLRLPVVATGSGGGDNDKLDNDQSTDLVNRLLRKVISPPSQSASASAAAAAAPVQETAPPTVIFALDLADPAAVHPSMEAMVAALLRRYDNAGADVPSRMTASASATTRLSKLRSIKFGTASEQSEEGPSETLGGGEGGSAATKIALIICCAVPEGGGVAGAPQSFQQKQAVSLVHYHLHRFASEVDCTLAFVRPDDDGANPPASEPSGEEGGEGDNASATAKSKGPISSMTVTELASIVSRVASGMTPIKEEEQTNDDDDETVEGDDAGEGQEGSAAEAEALEEQPPLFAPGTHDDDLIGSVLLRNASCPGVWDAAKDDLWKALPSSKVGGGGDKNASDKKKDGKVGGAAADEAWLSKLAASLPAKGATGAGDDVSVKSSKSSKSSATSGSSLAKASTKKKKPIKAPSANADSKNDDPTSFFENLMKK